MVQAGAVPITWMFLAAELQRDWAGGNGARLRPLAGHAARWAPRCSGSNSSSRRPLLTRVSSGGAVVESIGSRPFPSRSQITQLTSGADPEFPEDAAQLRVDRSWAEHQLRG